MRFAARPDVVFEVDSPLNFTNPATVNAFLTSGGAFNITGSAAALSRPMSDGAIGTLLRFSGMVSVSNGQLFTVTHDDGLTLIIGGLLVIDAAGPTAPIQTIASYTGRSGAFPFELVYGECCTGPAVLQIGLDLQPGLIRRGLRHRGPCRSRGRPGWPDWEWPLCSG